MTPLSVKQKSKTMKIKKRIWALVPLLMVSAILYTSCQPLREFESVPVYNSTVKHEVKQATFDASKKTVVIVAHNKGTEIFDLLAPYYLFNATEKANVYIVAENKSPIVLLKGTSIYPNLTFAALDSLKIEPDVIVIPAMVSVFQDPKSPIIQWIKEKSKNNPKVLSVCAGSLVGAASGLYDGKPLTTHASMFEESKEAFRKPVWVQNVSVTKSDNLYSTAGVSNAVEGSLTIIQELFGKAILEQVMSDIHYPYTEIKTAHQSLAVTTGNKFTIANKLVFKKNRKVGVLLQDGVNELKLAAVLDTYHRTFPSALETFVSSGSAVTSKYGLTIVPTGSLTAFKPDEIHVLLPDNLSKSDREQFKEIPVIEYTATANRYIINQCLERIKTQYGPKFENITKLLLDYNLKEVCPLSKQ